MSRGKESQFEPSQPVSAWMNASTIQVSGRATMNLSRVATLASDCRWATRTGWSRWRAERRRRAGKPHWTGCWPDRGSLLPPHRRAGWRRGGPTPPASGAARSLRRGVQCGRGGQGRGRLADGAAVLFGQELGVLDTRQALPVLQHLVEPEPGCAQGRGCFLGQRGGEREDDRLAAFVTGAGLAGKVRPPRAVPSPRSTRRLATTASGRRGLPPSSKMEGRSRKRLNGEPRQHAHDAAL